MAKKIARLLFTCAGAALGAALVMAVDRAITSFGYLSMQDVMYTWGVALVYVAAGIIFAIILYIISPRIINAVVACVSSVEKKLSEMAIEDVLYCALGLIVGLLIAFLASTLTSGIKLNFLSFIIDAALYILFGYLGFTVMYHRKGELSAPVWMSKRKADGGKNAAKPKILDTSVIIDGRISDICATGIVEGSVIVPVFVLKELQHIADSADALKRNRGRRGLDILKTMQEEGSANITVLEKDYEDIPEVDSKLIRMAADMGGVVVTNDYNLNKVAAVHSVPVLNINELANAVKPMVLPGEDMTIEIIKEGKELGQGIGYLVDGTMIVVENGRKHMGEMTDITVTSVLQTAAGRMIFAKLR